MTFTFVGPQTIAVTRWTFLDPTDGSTAEFELNPSEGGALARKRVVSTESRRAPGAKTVIVTNAEGIKEFTFDGTILTESMYDMFVLWFNKTHPVEITDDLGRTFNVYIIKFEPRRVRKTNDPWFHTYTVTGIII